MLSIMTNLLFFLEKLKKGEIHKSTLVRINTSLSVWNNNYMLKLEQMYGCESHKGRLENYNQPNRSRNQSAVGFFLRSNSRFS